MRVTTNAAPTLHTGLLQRVGEHYPVISFELTSENGR